MTLRPLAKIVPSFWQQSLKSGSTRTYPAYLEGILTPGLLGDTSGPRKERDDAAPDAAQSETRAVLRRIMTRDVGVQRFEEDARHRRWSDAGRRSSSPPQASC